jgi:hypothetical protein
MRLHAIATLSSLSQGRRMKERILFLGRSFGIRTTKSSCTHMDSLQRSYIMSHMSDPPKRRKRGLCYAALT